MLYAGPHGMYEAWYENGQKCTETMYEHGQMRGIQRHWYENGQKRWEVTIINGEYDGLVQHWHENGQKFQEGTYTNGKKIGWYREWNEDGSIHKLEFYRHGELITFQTLATEKRNIFMEELMMKLNHPDRLERIAKQYNMDVMDYLECID